MDAPLKLRDELADTRLNRPLVNQLSERGKRSWLYRNQKSAQSHALKLGRRRAPPGERGKGGAAAEADAEADAEVGALGLAVVVQREADGDRPQHEGDGGARAGEGERGVHAAPARAHGQQRQRSQAMYEHGEGRAVVLRLAGVVAALDVVQVGGGRREHAGLAGQQAKPVEHVVAGHRARAVRAA